METSHDSIKYIEPVYTNAQRNDFDWDLNQGSYTMDNRFDDVSNNRDVMYESTESRYATEIVNVPASKITGTGANLVVNFTGVTGDTALTGNYIPTSSVLYAVVGGERIALAVQTSKAEWFGGKDVLVDADGEVYLQVSAAANSGTQLDTTTFTVQAKKGAAGTYSNATLAITDGTGTITIGSDTVNVTFAAVGRFDSEKDLTGKYLGEVELQMRDYHFRPRPISLGVTWTELTELVLDTSFGVSAEEMLMDSAAQEIKKTLDYQAVKYANNIQKVKASDNFVQFDAAAGDTTDDSYWHTAQIINQAIGHVEDNMLNGFGRGGVSAIVGGPKACRYLELNEGWTNKGKQPAIGGHKVGELNGRIWNAVVKAA